MAKLYTQAVIINLALDFMGVPRLRYTKNDFKED